MIRVTFDDKRVQELFRELPKFANPEMNLAFAGIGSAFYKRFDRELRKSIKVKRKISGGKKGRSRYQVTVPKASRAMGFTGKMYGVGNLRGKTLRVGTRNPQIISHILGATITGKGGKGLKIRVTTRAAARKSPDPQHKLPFFYVLRSVKIPARVDFYGIWNGMSGEIDSRLQKGVERLVARVNRVGVR